LWISNITEGVSFETGLEFGPSHADLGAKRAVLATDREDAIKRVREALMITI
jgi:hypothetical protein